MTLFEAVKQSVTTRQAAEYYGIRVNRNGMCLCPFHEDKHPSMKVDKRFHCFACQADGDVIDFASRLHGLDAKEAAKRLAADFGIHYDGQGRASPRPVKPKISEKLKQYQAEQRFFRVYADYLHLMKDWRSLYARRTPEENWHPLFVEALQNQDYVEYLLDSYLSGTEEERAELAFAHRDEQNKVFPRFEGRMPGAKSGGMEFWSTKRRHNRKLYRKDASVKELSRSSQRLCCPERVTGP